MESNDFGKCLTIFNDLRQRERESNKQSVEERIKKCISYDAFMKSGLFDTICFHIRQIYIFMFSINFCFECVPKWCVRGDMQSSVDYGGIMRSCMFIQHSHIREHIFLSFPPIGVIHSTA